MEKDWLKRPSDGQQQEARKKTLIRLLLLRRRQPVSCTLVTTRVPGSQAAVPPSCSTLTGAELSQAKEVLHLRAQSRFSPVQLCEPVDYGLPGFSVREGILQARIRGVDQHSVGGHPGEVRWTVTPKEGKD